MGRVNSWERISHVAAWAVDSVDGTFLKHVPPGDRQVERWVRALDARQELFPEYVEFTAAELAALEKWIAARDRTV